jgi:hypothetical protein
MSIVALALRLCAVKALQGTATAAGERVFDSAVIPIDQLVSKQPLPIVSISTEDETTRPSGRDLNGGDRTIDLVIEVAIGQSIPLPNDEGFEFYVADTDAMLELSVAVISRQILATLFNAGGGVWGDAFRAFAKTIEGLESRRGLPDKDGQRFAARQMILRVKAQAEPQFDQAVDAGTPFAKFLAALDSDPSFHQVASILRQAIEGKPVGWPELYTKPAINAGLTEEEGQKIGIAPLGGHASDPVLGFETHPDGVIFDQTLIDTALAPEQDD